VSKDVEKSPRAKFLQQKCPRNFTLTESFSVKRRGEDLAQTNAHVKPRVEELEIRRTSTYDGEARLGASRKKQSISKLTASRASDRNNSNKMYNWNRISPRPIQGMNLELDKWVA